MLKNLRKEFRSLIKSSGLHTQTKKLKSRYKNLIVLILFLIASSANATDYYVSNNGNDSNTGTSPDQAWKTLDKVNSFTPSPGDKILFNRGDEWVGTIKVNASGRLGSNIVYGEYGSGSKPKIYGSEIISGWTKHSGNIYKAQFNRDITQLFIDDKKITLARYPNGGYFKIKSTNGKSYLSSNDFNQSLDYSGANIFVRTEAWAIETETVTSQSSNILHVTSGYYRYDSGEGFFLNNKLDFLDETGEWYYDSSSNTVYLWTEASDSPTNYTVRGSTTNEGITASDVDYVNIENLDIRHQNDFSIYLDNCSYITIDGCIINDAGLNGILLGNSSSNHVTVSNNTIQGASQNGLKMYGTYNVVTNNTINNIGTFENVSANGFGNRNEMYAIIMLGQYSEVLYNNITNIGYSGIRLTTAPDSKVHYNYLYNTCHLKDDGGAIYTWNSSLSDPGCQNTTIKYNIIEYVPGAIDGYTNGRGVAYGIYLDDYSHTITVEHNTIAHTSSANIFTHHGQNNTFRYNTCFDGRWGLWTQSGGLGHSFTNNIIYSFNEDMDGYFREVLVGHRYTGATPTYDHNTYINHYRSSDVYRIEESWYNFSDWKKKTGNDANSTADHSPLADGETEKLFYNETKTRKRINLGSTIYRDLYGNNVSGSITLEPFTSKILIKTTSESRSSNQSPSIQNQTFETTGNLTLNKFIGQVVASDPDNGQILTYSIIHGNENGLFYIDSGTGEIYSSSDAQNTQDKTVVLTVEVTDDDAQPLSASANFSVNIIATNKTETNTQNHFPKIENQTFNWSGNLSLNQLIGQIIVSDPDSQTLTFSIISGNEDGLFYIDSSTGEIYSQKNHETTEEKSYILQLEVTDNSSSPLSSSASTTINLTPLTSNNIVDSEPPVITLFEIPSINYGYEAPIFNFLASDNFDVTEYALSISPEATLLNDTMWESTIPTTYVFLNEGVRVLYAWAKDAAGNISLVATDTVNIVLPDLSPSFSEYLFEENDSTIVTDSQSNNIGNILNEEIRTEGINGKGLEFTGLGYINLGKSFGDNIKDEVTLSAWIKPTLDSTSSGYQSIIMHGGPGVDTYALYISPNQKRIIFKTTGTSSEWTYAENIEALWDGEWHFLTATYDGSEKKIFLDNILIKDIPATGDIDFGPDYNLLVGAGRDKIPSSLFYEGTIDEVRIYNYALTTSEILNLYALSAPKKTMLTEEDISICQGQDYFGWNETNQYYRTLESETGADSIVITNLFVNPVYNTDEEIVIQEGESYNGWKESGQYQRTLATIRGCDSIVTTNLTVITQSVYSEYQFEELSGTTVIDSEGSNNGTIFNEELRLNGFAGKGLKFTGSGYINLGQTFGNIQNEVTLSAWILPDATSTGYQGIIMHGGPNMDTYALYINPDVQRVAFKTTGTSASWSYKDNVSKLWDGNWHHVAVTYNGAEKIVYLDNEVLLKTASTGSIESGEGYNLMIAAGRDKAIPTILYEGLIDEVRIYNYAITGTEISNLYNMADTDTVYTEVNVEICDGESYKGWTESGQYEQILKTSSGADSLVTTNLTVRPTYNISEHITIYKGENYEGWTESGQYQRIFFSAFGCDSIVVTNLTVAQTDSSYYEWSSSDRYRRVTNDSADSLEIKNGTKAAKISFAKGKTSYIQQPGLVQNYNFKIYPNPAKSYITIEHDFHPSLNTQIEILNIKGISVLKRSLSQINGKLSLTELPKGIYFVQCSNSKWKDSLKLIVL